MTDCRVTFGGYADEVLAVIDDLLEIVAKRMATEVELSGRRVLDDLVGFDLIRGRRYGCLAIIRS